MSKLYTISNFIRNDELPKYESTERIVSDYFYLFKIYSKNPYTIHGYIEFINCNFSNVFNHMRISIIEYDYPSDLKDELDIIKFINNYYHLSQTPAELSLDYAVQIHPVPLLENDSKFVYIYINNLLSYESSIIGDGIFNDEMETIDRLLGVLCYFNNSQDRELLKTFLMVFYDYSMMFSGYLLTQDDFYNYVMIIEPAFLFAQLKSFVRHERRRRLGYE